MKNAKYALLLAALLLLTSCGDPLGESKIELAPGDGSDSDIIQYEMDENALDGSSASEFTPSDAAPYDYMANDLTGFVQLGKYSGLTVMQASADLTDEEFEEEIGLMMESYSYYEKIDDRPVEEGDTVIADYSGFKDGVAFDGGTAQDQTIVCQSGSGYIDGFAEAFIGQTPGQEFEFNVTFPEDYGAADLAGVEVTFRCTVHSIVTDELIVPELTDEFVKENFGFNNVEEFRISFRGNVEEQKKSYVEGQMRSDLWRQIVDNAQVLSYPEEEVLRIYSQNRTMYEDYAAYYGTDYDTFLTSYMNTTDEELMENSRGYVKEDLVMYQLIKELGVELDDAEFEERVTVLAQSNGLTEDDLLSYYGEDTIRSTVLWEKLMDVVSADSNIIVE